MKILSRTSCNNEFAEEGDYILVPVDASSASVMAKRISLCRQACAEDDNTHQISFWDFSPALVTEGSWIQKLTDSEKYRLDNEGWIFVKDSMDAAEDCYCRTDLRQMVVSRCGVDYDIEWNMHLKDNATEFSSRRISLAEIRRHLRKSEVDSLVDDVFEAIMGGDSEK